jgi:hypothetical protein
LAARIPCPGADEYLGAIGSEQVLGALERDPLLIECDAADHHQRALRRDPEEAGLVRCGLNDLDLFQRLGWFDVVLLADELVK